jgi:hypothetical protein
MKNRVNMDLQKEYLLADLLTIPMDSIHGYFCKNNIPIEAYSYDVLKALLQRQDIRRYELLPIDEANCCRKLQPAAGERVNATLERVYSCFRYTAERYFQGQTQERIQLLLDKKERDDRTHMDNKCVKFYRNGPLNWRGVQGLRNRNSYSIPPQFPDIQH